MFVIVLRLNLDEKSSPQSFVGAGTSDGAAAYLFKHSHSRLDVG